MPGFRFEQQDLTLPKGAFSGARRHMLHWQDRPLLGVTEGTPRCYLYPVFTLNGFPATAESPADHPHHNSIWIAADHVHCAVPTQGDDTESYTYNFYVNDTFQGRAPGNQVVTAISGHDLGGDRYRLDTTIDWRGPAEWGAPTGRTVITERRSVTISIAADRTLYTLDLASELTARPWALSIGPTRHAFFNVRLADVMRGSAGVSLLSEGGATTPEALTASAAGWVSANGPVGGGHRAGLVVRPDGGPNSWFVSDWGVVTVGSMRTRPVPLQAGESLAQGCRILVHDGPASAIDIPARLLAAPEEGTTA
ncbi:MAG: DUF6807 family protein [Azospirillaceae bacterium]